MTSFLANKTPGYPGVFVPGRLLLDLVALLAATAPLREAQRVANPVYIHMPILTKTSYIPDIHVFLVVVHLDYNPDTNFQ